MRTINFKDNLEKAINELLKKNNISNTDNLSFIIVINEEEKAKMKSKDLLYFPYPVVENKILEKKDVVRILSGPRCTFPLWIDMSLVGSCENIIIQLKCSCRFRKALELQNQDRDFPPFRLL